MRTPTIQTYVQMDAELRIKIDKARGDKESLRSFLEEGAVLLLEKREGMAK